MRLRKHLHDEPVTDEIVCDEVVDFDDDMLDEATPSDEVTPFADSGETVSSPQSENIPAWWFVSAHGGAGASTLAAVIDPAGDADHRLPVGEKYPFAIIVCEATVNGLDAAQTMVKEGQVTDGVDVVGVAVVQKSRGRLAGPIKNRIKVVAPTVGGRVWTIPPVESFTLRALDDLPWWAPGALQGKRSRKERRDLPDEFLAVADAMARDVYTQYLSSKEET